MPCLIQISTSDQDATVTEDTSKKPRRIAAIRSVIKEGRKVIAEGPFTLVATPADAEALLSRLTHRAVFKTDELSQAEIQEITESGMDPRHDHLNAELE